MQPVFEAIAESAKRLLGSHTAVVTRVIDGVVHFAAGTAENEPALHGVQGLLPYPLSSTRIHARVARTGELAVNTDVDASDLPQNIKEFARAIGWRSMLVVPMLRNGIAIGTIGITRREAGSFDDKTIGLLKTFADQAVIAIENARLFNETQEALERQTATADILKVIASSPSDVQPVFEAIAEAVEKLSQAISTTRVHALTGRYDALGRRSRRQIQKPMRHSGARSGAALSEFQHGANQSAKGGDLFRVIRHRTRKRRICAELAQLARFP